MKVIIIIPTLNEAEGIQKLIRHIKRSSDKENIEEILIVDGNSEDNTYQKAEECGVRTVISEIRGRSRQMNIGAELANGDILYFLHADSYPPENFDEAIIESVQNGHQAGCFRMQFDTKHHLLEFLCWFTRFKSTLCRGGDQSLYITRGLFYEIGMFNNDLLITEDLEIVSRIKKITKFKVITKTLVTSARKYKINGFYRLQLIFSIIQILCLLGVSHEVLYKFYKSKIRT